MSIKAKLIPKLPPATVSDCARDYQQHHQPEVEDKRIELSEQAKFHGKYTASGWHGRRTDADR